MWAKRFFICLLLSLNVVSAIAAPRQFPPKAIRGMMSIGVYPQVRMNGQVLNLSPGAKIVGQQNTIVMYSTLISSNLIVNFTVDGQGLVDRVWILTNEEIAQTPQQ